MKNALPFLSIIVPVYNVEEYLVRCFNSVIQQSFTNWEMLVMDDCSPDNSAQLIKNYEQKDSRIKYFKNEVNRGLGGTRNDALKFCKGSYILYLDSDDYISDHNALTILCSIVRKHNLDILDTPYRRIEDERETLLPKKFKKFDAKIYSGIEYLQQIQILPIVAWNKVYKAEFLRKNQLVFKERKYEDICFTLESLYKANRVQNSTTAFYNYIIRPGSIMTSKVSKSSVNDALSLCSDLETLYIQTNKNPEVEKNFLYSFVSLTEFLEDYEDKKDAAIVRNEFKKIYKKYRFSILKAKKLGLPQKLSLFVSPSVTLRLLKWFKR